jgi:hypothetical protein
MASKEELFVSLSPSSYRMGKSGALGGQADLLEVLKHLHNLKVLSRQKQDLKKRLHKLLASTIIEIDSIQDKIPTARVPKAVQKPADSEVEPKKDFSKRDDIEEELTKIQEKLRELNG